MPDVPIYSCTRIFPCILYYIRIVSKFYELSDSDYNIDELILDK